MNHSQDLSNKIRPFLNALERGIDSARQRRLTGAGEAEDDHADNHIDDDLPAGRQRPAPPDQTRSEHEPQHHRRAAPGPTPPPPDSSSDAGFDPRKVKARPKRPSPHSHQGSIPPRTDPSNGLPGENNHRHAG